MREIVGYYTVEELNLIHKRKAEESEFNRKIAETGEDAEMLRDLLDEIRRES